MEGPDDDRVGYQKPPVKHQFKKGKSGNPRGRPKKIKPAVQTNDRLIMQKLDSETVEIDGVPQSKREVELRILQAKALKGDLQAMKMLDQKRTSLKLDQPAPRGGVLRVPVVSSAQWRRDAEIDQAKYRDKNYSPVAELDKILEENRRKAEGKGS